MTTNLTWGILCMLNSTIVPTDSSSFGKMPTCKTRRLPLCLNDSISIFFSNVDRMIEIDRVNINFIFPVQFAVGIIGNIINLVVLRKIKSYRSIATTVLCGISAFDFLFFMSIFLVRFRGIAILRQSFSYFRFWVFAHIPLMMLANWFSTVSIWLSVLLTLERVIAVKYPFHAKMYMGAPRVRKIMISITAASLVLNFHPILGRTVLWFPICNFTSPSSSSSISPQYDESEAMRTRFSSAEQPHTPRYGDVCEPEWLVSYVLSSRAAAIILTVFLPLPLVIVLNAMLMRIIVKSKRIRAILMEGLRHRPVNSSQEARITRLAFISILSFIFFNVPTGITYFLRFADVFPSHRSYYKAAQVSNILVVTGRMINVVLYCSGSACYRQYLLLASKNYFEDSFGRLSSRLHSFNLRRPTGTECSPVTKLRHPGGLHVNYPSVQYIISNANSCEIDRKISSPVVEKNFGEVFMPDSRMSRAIVMKSFPNSTPSHQQLIGPAAFDNDEAL